jgi:hypothetical protein
MEKACMIIDKEGNVVEVGHPECIMKRKEYWEEKGCRFEITDKSEAMKRYRNYLKTLSDDDFS